MIRRLGVVLPIPVTAVPARFGLIRGVTVAMLGTRAPMLRLGERMMLCASTAAPSKYASGIAATVSASIACRALLRQLAPSWTMKPQAFALAIARRAAQGVATARLTIFSPCSLLIRLATSSFGIALLPNCRRNRPPLVSYTHLRAHETGRNL